MSDGEREQARVEPDAEAAQAVGRAATEPAPDEEATPAGEAEPQGPAGIPELHEVDCPPELREEIETAMSRYPQKRSASIPALWAVQRLYGWCSPEGMRQAAAVMGVTPAYLESVATFYDLFSTTPVGQHRVLICHNISCWLHGAEDLLDAFCEAAGCDPHEVDHRGERSADDALYLKGFECLGACDIAPMVSIDERYYGPLTPDDARSAVEQIRSGEEVLPDKALAKRPAAGGPEPDPDPRVEKVESDGG